MSEVENLSKRARGNRAGKLPPVSALAAERDALIVLLEPAWAEIGWPLIRARTREDLIAAFQPLCRSDGPASIALLFRSRVQKVPPSEMRQAARRASKSAAEVDQLTGEFEASAGRFREAWATFEQFERIARQAAAPAHAGDSQGHMRDALISEVLRLLADASLLKNRLDRAIRQQAVLEDSVEDQKAHFAQMEALAFLHRRRHPLEPRALAAALAGLPHGIGCRQSSARCATVPCTLPIHPLYGLFLFVQRTWEKRQSCRKDHLFELFRAQRDTAPAGEQVWNGFLETHWRLFEKVVEDSLAALPAHAEDFHGAENQRQIPFAIAARFSAGISGRTLPAPREPLAAVRPQPEPV